MTNCICGYQADSPHDLQGHMAVMRSWLSTPVGSHKATPVACRSCGFADCPNAGNALDYCPRWDGTDQGGGES